VLFTLEETPAQLRSIMTGLGLDLAALEASGDLVLRYTSPVELSTDRFLYEAREQLHELGARRAVFDSLTTMSLGVASERRFKEMVYAITKHLRGMLVTSVMTAESMQLLGTAHLTGDGVSFIADNVIQLRYVELDGKLERAISVLKARGIKHESELRSMTIGPAGAQVIAGRFRDMRGVLTGLPSEKGTP
jgi:circadian clock protein KaiC